MEITILGTGNAQVTECYNTCFVLHDNGKYLLVDGGGGNTLLAQLKHAGLSWKDMREIFVTHKHIDHLLGIVWMLRMLCQGMARGQYEGEATIYAHDEVIALLRQLAQMLLLPKETRFIDDRLHLVTVSDGEERTLIGNPVTFFDIHSTKAKQFGFTMRASNDKKLVCCGDEPYSEAERPYALGSDLMMHEAFCLYAQADIFDPYKKNHSTVKDACELAEGLGIPNLLLYHTEDRNIHRRKELYTAEGKQYYSGNLLIPDDLDVITL